MLAQEKTTRKRRRNFACIWDETKAMSSPRESLNDQCIGNLCVDKIQSPRIGELCVDKT